MLNLHILWVLMVWVEGLSDASAPLIKLLLGNIDKATTWWVVQGCFKLYVGETLTEISKLFGLRTCRCGVWIVISAYVGKHNYLLSWTTDAWLRQPKIGIRQYFKSKHFLQALRVSIAETHSTFTISPSRARGVVILSEWEHLAECFYLS